jgi:hypothetical protein
LSRHKEEPSTSDSAAAKKGKKGHPSSLSHSLFDSGKFGEGGEDDEDDLFSSPLTTTAAATKKSGGGGKAKPVASKDMDALFDEIDQGTCTHTYITFPNGCVCQ